MSWKLIAAIILIIIGFNLLFVSYMKRRIASTKAEGYRRQREDGASGTDSSSDSASGSSSASPSDSSGSDSGWDNGSSSDSGGGGDGGGGGD